MNYSDLAAAAARRDREAFSELIRMNELAMYKAARAILSNNDDAADAMQDAILSAWENIETLRQPRYFNTWLMKILINASISILRQRGRVVLAEPETERGAEDMNFRAVEWKQQLAALDEKYRVLLVLYYSEGYRIREIADMLNLNENTVKTRLAAAREQYRQLEYCS